MCEADVGSFPGFAMNSASPRPLVLVPSEQKREGNKCDPPPPFLRGGRVLMRNITFESETNLSVKFSQYLIRFILNKCDTYCNLFLNTVFTWHFT